MRKLVETLCSPPCAGRAPGTPEGRAARATVVSALRDAGLDPHEQAVPKCGGANVLATIPARAGELADRWVLVGAHYDHLGKFGNRVFWGADDNAAAVGILVDVARALARERADGRSVIIAAFDGEEPPWFETDGMGSQHFARNPIVPLDRIDMMVCMDLVGHAFGVGLDVPADVAQSVFALGAERSEKTLAHVTSIARAEPGVTIRPADAEIIPPLSDYDPFWRRGIPFLFLTAGRSRYYHTPDDTPEHLDWAKMQATARWLERFVRDTCARADRISSTPRARDDRSTLESLLEITTSLADLSIEAAIARDMTADLLEACGAGRSLPKPRRAEVEALVGALESRLA